MKSKLFLLVAILSLLSIRNAEARNYDNDVKNEISVAYGAGGTSATLNIFDCIIDGLAGAKYDHAKFVGPISAEYFYHIKPLFGVGLIGAYTYEKKDVLQNKVVTGKQTAKFFTVMPAVKLNWLRRGHWGLYSKAGIGYSRANYTTSGVDDSGKALTEKRGKNFVNFQLSLLGAEAGFTNVRAFAELGFGEQGVILGGIRMRF